MEAPARGMLCRPKGLLAGTTTRARRCPEAMGQAAAAVPPEPSCVEDRATAVSGGGTVVSSTRAVRPSLPVELALPLVGDVQLVQATQIWPARL